MARCEKRLCRTGRKAFVRQGPIGIVKLVELRLDVPLSSLGWKWSTYVRTERVDMMTHDASIGSHILRSACSVGLLSRR
jgi:hypothetical protein